MAVTTEESSAQLFPGLEGQPLIDALRNAYTPAQLLTEPQVKDTLYMRVFRTDDSVRCIYSDLARELPEGVDPSQYLYGNGTETGSINLEHGWPQSKGAGKGTMGNRNMHHLYPSRSAINSDRADFPFSEIKDAAAQKWYYRDKVMSAIPGSGIDLYSEFRNGTFEPRESVKGDIARAMMYFWTLYREDAESKDPNFFDVQQPTLCQWDEQDPVDEFERLRSATIAEYQEGKENPFILDCTLAKRTYCPGQVDCVSSTSEIHWGLFPSLYVDMNLRTLRIIFEEDRDWNIRIWTTMGILVDQFQLSTEEESQALPGPPGPYFLTVSDYRVSKTFRIILL